MKLRLHTFVGFLLGLVLPMSALGLSPKLQGPGITTANANLRAKPSLNSEILISLKKGQQIHQIGTAHDPKAPADEPKEWVEVTAPIGTKVWIFAALVDPASKTVRSAKVNLRAGPGRNYSEVGYLLQGAAIQELRSADGWIQIAAPEGSVTGYIARDLVNAAPDLVVEKSSSPVTGPTPRQTVPLPMESAKPRLEAGRSLPAEGSVVRRLPDPAPVPDRVEERAILSTVETIPPTPPEAVPEVLAAALPVETAQAPVQTSSEIMASAQPEIIHTDKPRQVIREGVVGVAMSPQAPSDYQLNNFRKGEGMIGFLATDNPEIKLSSWRWRRVLITGEEYLDVRWPKSPLIKVISIQPAF